MKAEIVSVGTELLLGEIVDTNSAHIARTLRDLGISIFYKTTVGDNLQRITEVLQQGLSRSDVIITTGGLGPTVDDMTRHAAAAAAGRALEFHQELLDQIAERFAKFGVEMTENNHQQAYIPAGAFPLENPVGTAPCYIVEDEQGIIISLPGVPTEMKYILAHQVVPYLREKSGGSAVIKALILRTAGIGESTLDTKIGDLMTGANPTVGLSAHTGQTDIRITARADSEAEADHMLEVMEAEIRGRAGEYIYGTGHMPLEAAFIETLQQLNFRLAICEVGTGASLRQRLTEFTNGESIPAVALAYDDLDAFLEGMVSTAAGKTLEDYATMALDYLQTVSDAQVRIVLITQRDGTVVVVHTPDKSRVRNYGYGGEETRAPVWTGTWSMSIAWRLLRESIEADV